ncbi:MAG: glycosyltransferase family 4 protein [Desulfovibrionaceae bacterium]|nr:glycosyltransferase family 4 protein [Desulfovibrionaceae bacterium]
MKILIANKYFYPKGGAETVFFQERSWLLQQGHCVIDFSMQHPSNKQSDYSNLFVDNVDYNNDMNLFSRIKAASSFIHNSSAVKKVDTICRQYQPQIAHLHNIYHQLTPSIIHTLKDNGVKVVLTAHDGKIICPNYVMLNNGKPCIACKGQYFWYSCLNNCKASLGQSILLTVESLFHRIRNSYGLLDRIISPSKFLAKLIIESGYPAEKVVIVNNGIDVDDLTPTFSDRGYALYYGRLSKEKGLMTLCAASKKMKIPLRVVGTGPLRQELMEEYPDIRFDGFLSGKPLKDAINGARCVVVPSEWYENCSMVVLEAMALGKAVVGARIGGIPEQVLDGDTGYLFTPGSVNELVEKVNTLAHDPNHARHLGIQARARAVDVYSLEKHFTAIDQVFQEVLA